VEEGNQRRYAETLAAGVPIMVITLFTVLATTSGRLGIGVFSGADMAAEYAVLFRATAAPIVAHQIIVVARYRALFELPLEKVQRQISSIVGLVGLAVIGFWICSDVIAWAFGPAFVYSFQRNQLQTYLILSQCLLWSAIALNDLLATRAGIARTVAGWSAIYFALALPLACWYLAGNVVHLGTFVVTHSALMLGYFLTQAVAMRKAGIRFTATWTLSAVSFGALALLPYVLYASD
jgi:hypothetical protein